jgi:homoserine O-acetyltransferase/O-succinyltransferase
MPSRLRALIALAGLTLSSATLGAEAPAWPNLKEGDFTIADFKFRSGESLAALKLHYRTLGTPHYDAAHQIDNAVMILHGTGGDGTTFLRPIFGGELFGPGQILDAAHYFIILPDGIGHGHSSKPSDGLKAKFPHYDYDDMVEAEHRLVKDGLGVGKLRLILGTSMGCMHAFVWGESYGEDVSALAPFACLPVRIVGRNRLWRRMVIDAIESDPAWAGGEYQKPPLQGLRAASDILALAGSAPAQQQKSLPSPEAVDENLAKRLEGDLAHLDANDLIYQVDASRDYDPEPKLGLIKTPVLWINSADDFINPPELGIAEAEAPKLAHGRFVLLPISDKTHGHGTHTWAAAWKDELGRFMAETERKEGG